MLFLNLLLTFGAIGLIVFGIMTGPWPFVAGVVLLIISLIFWGGFMMLEPNEARVVMFFGNTAVPSLLLAITGLIRLLTRRSSLSVPEIWMQNLLRLMIK